MATGQAAAVQLKAQLDQREAALNTRKARVAATAQELDQCSGLG